MASLVANGSMGGVKGTGSADRLGAWRSGSLGHRLIAATGLAMLLGIGGVILFHAQQQQSEIVAANERTLLQIAESAQRGLETIMMGGYADVAPYYAERLKDLKDLDDFRILRLDGREAFLDNQTVAAINTRFGTEIFPPKPTERIAQVLPPDSAPLQRAATGQTVTFAETDAAGDDHLTLLSPIVLNERCRACHGDSRNINGVIKVTMSLAAVQAEVRRTWWQAVLMLLAAVPVLVAMGWYATRRWILRPVETVSTAMARVADGHFDQAVPVPSKDELGQMAESFNKMLDQVLRTYDGLQNEQNKLTTIILAAVEGIVVADDMGQIVLVNPAAERLLEKRAHALMGEDLVDLLDDRTRMRGWLDAGSSCADVDYRGRILAVQVARIADEAGELVGSSALLRDVTEERRLEQRLRSLSTTDALTGLWNRRHLDQTLATEFERARRYGLSLSVLLFDIDHFKRFNDTYGHDQGDRVIKAVADQIGLCVRNVDVACRYGGEEFAVILPGTDLDGAMETAERLRARVAATLVDGLAVTVTIGVAALPPLDPAGPAQMMETADKALYDGKRAGRNRVVAAAAVEA